MEISTAVKIGAAVVKNRKSIGKLIFVVVVIMMMPTLLAAMLYMQILSAFEADGVLKTPEETNIEETAIYNSIHAELDPYHEALKEQLATERWRALDMYTVRRETGDDEMEIIEPNVMRRLNYIPENIIVAYLLMCGGIQIDTAQVNGRMIHAFLGDIIDIRVTFVGDNTYWVENHLMTVQDIANRFFEEESDRERFLMMCEAYGEYFDVALSIEIDGHEVETVCNPVLENLSDVPLYLQYDNAWKDVPYGNGTIKKTGCCPTCLAMVFSYFHGTGIYPNDVVAWSGNRYYVNGTGTAWSIFTAAADQWGISCTNIGKNAERMSTALQSGKLVIASMGPGTFTQSGHFIVLTGINESGNVKVNDPNDSGIKKHVEKEFSVSLIIRECKNMWVFG